MSDEVKWLIGALAAFVTLVGGLIGRDRQQSKMIREGDDRLHERVNRVREEYVRRDDMNNHITRLETNVKDMRDEFKEHAKETNRRLDVVIAALSKNTD